MSDPGRYIISRDSRPDINEQLTHRAVLAQQRAAGASNTVSDPEAHAPAAAVLCLGRPAYRLRQQICQTGLPS